MERWAWNTLRTRGEAERDEGGSIYRNIVTKKRKLLIMEYNKKKCVIAFVISFFYLMLSLFIFEKQYFHGGVLFWHTFSKDAVFCIVICLIYSGSHHSKWVLAKNSNNNTHTHTHAHKRKRSIVPMCDTWPNSCPSSFFAPSVAGKTFGNST